MKKKPVIKNRKISKSNLEEQYLKFFRGDDLSNAYQSLPRNYNSDSQQIVETWVTYSVFEKPIGFLRNA